MTTHQVEKKQKIEVNKEPTETLEQKNIITETKTSTLEGLNHRSGCNNSKLEDRSFQIIHSEKQVEK